MGNTLAIYERPIYSEFEYEKRKMLIVMNLHHHKIMLNFEILD